MDIFLLLLGKLVPLYIVIALGYIAGRNLRVSRESVGMLLLYIVAPVVVFHGVYATPLQAGLLSLPVVFLLISFGLCAIFYGAASLRWRTSERNIIAFAAGTGNTGYFGLPVALALFGDHVLGIVVFATFGLILYENSLGFFVVARGSYSARESLRKLLRLPTIYAFALGIALQLLRIDLGSAYADIALSFRGAYSILGMMMVGLGLSTLRHVRLDVFFLSIIFLAKFIVWPVIALVIIALDRSFVHLYSPDIHHVLFLLSLTPVAANTVTLTSVLGLDSEKASSVVFLSTAFALVFIPFMVSVLL